MPIPVVIRGETEPAVDSEGREGEASRYYWNSLAFRRARQVCFTDAFYDARGPRTLIVRMKARRVARFLRAEENAGESCDVRFPPFRNRANARARPGLTAF